MIKNYERAVVFILALLLSTIIFGYASDFDGNDDDGWHSETNISVYEKSIS